MLGKVERKEEPKAEVKLSAGFRKHLESRGEGDKQTGLPVLRADKKLKRLKEGTKGQQVTKLPPFKIDPKIFEKFEKIREQLLRKTDPKPQTIS